MLRLLTMSLIAAEHVHTLRLVYPFFGYPIEISWSTLIVVTLLRNNLFALPLKGKGRRCYASAWKLADGDVPLVR